MSSRQTEAFAAPRLSWRPIAEAEVTSLAVFLAIVANIMMPGFCILLGFWVAAARIRDPRAWLFLAMMISFAEVSGGGSILTWFGHDDLFQVIGAAYQQFAANVWGAAMMLFGIYFPERHAVDRRWPWVKWLLLAPILYPCGPVGDGHRVVGEQYRRRRFAKQILAIRQSRDSPPLPRGGLLFAAIAHKTFFGDESRRATETAVDIFLRTIRSPNPGDDLRQWRSQSADDFPEK